MTPHDLALLADEEPDEPVYVPTPERIERMKRIIRAVHRVGKRLYNRHGEGQTVGAIREVHHPGRNCRR